MARVERREISVQTETRVILDLSVREAAKIEALMGRTTDEDLAKLYMDIGSTVTLPQFRIVLDENMPDGPVLSIVERDDQ